MPKTCHIKLDVFNMIGQRIETIVDRKMNAGFHVVSFSGYNLGSGMYIYRLKADGFIQFHKMLLIK